MLDELASSLCLLAHVVWSWRASKGCRELRREQKRWVLPTFGFGLSRHRQNGHGFMALTPPLIPFAVDKTACTKEGGRPKPVATLAPMAAQDEHRIITVMQSVAYQKPTFRLTTSSSCACTVAWDVH